MFFGLQEHANSLRMTSTTDPPARVLIVDDQFIIAEDMAAAVREAGHVVCGKAATAAAAFRLALEHRPDVILMDVHLGPGADGITTASSLRAAGIGSAIVFLTATAAEARARIGEFGNASVVSKPATLADVVEAIHKHLPWGQQSPA